MAGRRAKLVGLAWVGAAAVVAVLFANSFSVLAHLVPFRTERAIANALDSGTKRRVCSTPGGTRALKKLLARLYPLAGDDPAIHIRVRVIRNPVVNAYAMLGGDIFVDQGLLKQARSPEELAGVLAHEITHVVLRHVLEGVMMRLGTWGALELILGKPTSTAELAMIMTDLHYSRSQERAADRGGLKRLVRAQVNVKGFEDFFQRMRHKGGTDLALFSDHPSDSSREDMARRYEGHPSHPVLTRSEWLALKGICGP